MGVGELTAAAHLSQVLEPPVPHFAHQTRLWPCHRRHITRERGGSRSAQLLAPHPRVNPSPAFWLWAAGEAPEGAESRFFCVCAIFDQVCHRASCFISQLFGEKPGPTFPGTVLRGSDAQAGSACREDQFET